MLQPPIPWGPTLDLVVHTPGLSLLRSAGLGNVVLAPGPWMVWIQGPQNWGCQVTPAHHPCL
jgi:hypothetical protein